MRKLTTEDLVGLSSKEVNFVIEYTKDFNPRRAAEAVGYEPDSGYGLTRKKNVVAAVERITSHRLETSHIDAEWVLMMAADNAIIAKQTGKISASNTALVIVAKHAAIDAFAAEKVLVASDEMIMERLHRGRTRMNEVRKQLQADDDEEVSFF